jgi:hypothetical protein
MPRQELELHGIADDDSILVIFQVCCKINIDTW